MYDIEEIKNEVAVWKGYSNWKTLVAYVKIATSSSIVAEKIEEAMTEVVRRAGATVAKQTKEKMERMYQNPVTVEEAFHKPTNTKPKYIKKCIPNEGVELRYVEMYALTKEQKKYIASLAYNIYLNPNTLILYIVDNNSRHYNLTSLDILVIIGDYAEVYSKEAFNAHFVTI
jgi:hypothetical protein